MLSFWKEGTPRQGWATPVWQKVLVLYLWNTAEPLAGCMNSEVLSWQIDWMTASSRKPKFHLNANTGIVLTLQCRVLTLTLSVQPPYKFPSSLLWPHNPKPSLAGNYMHFNIDNKQDLTSKYSAAMGFEIWTLNACVSRWYAIIGFFTRSFKSVRPLCKATKRIAKGCEISINIGSQKLNQLEKKIFSTYTFFGRLKVGKSWKNLYFERENSCVLSYTTENPRLLELVLQVAQLIWKLYRIYTSPVLIRQWWSFILHNQIQM